MADDGDNSDFWSRLFGGGGRAPLSLAPPGTDDGGGGEILDKITGGVNANSNLLLGLASGLAGGRTLGDALSKGFSAAAAGGQADSAQRDKTSARSALYKSLIQRGASPQDALTASYGGDALKALQKQLLPDTEYQKLGQSDTLYRTGPNGAVPIAGKGFRPAPLSLSPPRGPRGIY